MRTRVLLWISPLFLLFLNSCASTSTVILPPSEIGTPTSTPFQPGAVDAPFPLAFDPQALGTFTPYPTKYIYQNDLLTPIILPADVSEPASSFSNINPLTGLEPENPELLNRRPLAIKVANFPRYVRPQSGLSRADVVYEYYIEDLLTRFIAIFYGSDSTAIGPVRSGRYFDGHITHMYHSFLAFKFADPREYAFFKQSDFSEFLLVPPGYGTCPPYFVGGGARDYYNNVFFDSTRLSECAIEKGLDNTRQTIRSGFFNEEPPTSSAIIYRIFTRYSADDYNYWEYDPGTRRYMRFQEVTDTRNGKAPDYEPLVDKETGLQVNADNVVVLFVPHIFSTENEAEDEVYHIDLLSSGKAFLFRDGLSYEALWHRVSEDQPLLLTDLNGTPLFLKPGRTFHQVIGRDSTFTQNGVDIFFTFNTP